MNRAMSGSSKILKIVAKMNALLSEVKNSKESDKSNIKEYTKELKGICKVLNHLMKDKHSSGRKDAIIQEFWTDYDGKTLLNHICNGNNDPEILRILFQNPEFRDLLPELLNHKIEGATRSTKLVQYILENRNRCLVDLENYGDELKIWEGYLKVIITECDYKLIGCITDDKGLIAGALGGQSPASDVHEMYRDESLYLGSGGSLSNEREFLDALKLAKGKREFLKFYKIGFEAEVDASVAVVRDLLFSIGSPDASRTPEELEDILQRFTQALDVLRLKHSKPFIGESIKSTCSPKDLEEVYTDVLKRHKKEIQEVVKALGGRLATLFSGGSLLGNIVERLYANTQGDERPLDIQIFDLLDGLARNYRDLGGYGELDLQKQFILRVFELGDANLLNVLFMQDATPAQEIFNKNYFTVSAISGFCENFLKNCDDLEAFKKFMSALSHSTVINDDRFCKGFIQACIKLGKLRYIYLAQEGMEQGNHMIPFLGRISQYVDQDCIDTLVSDRKVEDLTYLVAQQNIKVVDKGGDNTEHLCVEKDSLHRIGDYSLDIELRALDASRGVSTRYLELLLAGEGSISVDHGDLIGEIKKHLGSKKDLLLLCEARKRRSNGLDGNLAGLDLKIIKYIVEQYNTAPEYDSDVDSGDIGDNFEMLKGYCSAVLSGLCGHYFGGEHKQFLYDVAVQVRELNREGYGKFFQEVLSPVFHRLISGRDVIAFEGFIEAFPEFFQDPILKQNITKHIKDGNHRSIADKLKVFLRSKKIQVPDNLSMPGVFDGSAIFPSPDIYKERDIAKKEGDSDRGQSYKELRTSVCSQEFAKADIPVMLPFLRSLREGDVRGFHALIRDDKYKGALPNLISRDNGHDLRTWIAAFSSPEFFRELESGWSMSKDGLPDFRSDSEMLLDNKSLLGGPLHFALEAQNYVMVEHLASHKFPKAFLSVDGDGNNPLHLAVLNKDEKAIKYFFQTFLANEGNHRDLVNIFLQTNNEGQSPLSAMIKDRSLRELLYRHLNMSSSAFVKALVPGIGGVARDVFREDEDGLAGLAFNSFLGFISTKLPKFNPFNLAKGEKYSWIESALASGSRESCTLIVNMLEGRTLEGLPDKLLFKFLCNLVSNPNAESEVVRKLIGKFRIVDASTSAKKFVAIATKYRYSHDRNLLHYLAESGNLGLMKDLGEVFGTLGVDEGKAKKFVHLLDSTDDRGVTPLDIAIDSAKDEGQFFMGLQGFVKGVMGTHGKLFDQHEVGWKGKNFVFQRIFSRNAGSFAKLIQAGGCAHLKLFHDEMNRNDLKNKDNLISVFKRLITDDVVMHEWLKEEQKALFFLYPMRCLDSQNTSDLLSLVRKFGGGDRVQFMVSKAYFERCMRFFEEEKNGKITKRIGTKGTDFIGSIIESEKLVKGFLGDADDSRTLEGVLKYFFGSVDLDLPERARGIKAILGIESYANRVWNRFFTSICRNLPIDLLGTIVKDVDITKKEKYLEYLPGVLERAKFCSVLGEQVVLRKFLEEGFAREKKSLLKVLKKGGAKEIDSLLTIFANCFKDGNFAGAGYANFMSLIYDTGNPALLNKAAAIIMDTAGSFLPRERDNDRAAKIEDGIIEGREAGLDDESEVEVVSSMPEGTMEGIEEGMEAREGITTTGRINSRWEAKLLKRMRNDIGGFTEFLGHVDRNQNVPPDERKLFTDCFNENAVKVERSIQDGDLSELAPGSYSSKLSVLQRFPNWLLGRGSKGGEVEIQDLKQAVTLLSEDRFAKHPAVQYSTSPDIRKVAKGVDLPKIKQLISDMNEDRRGKTFKKVAKEIMSMKGNVFSLTYDGKSVLHHLMDVHGRFSQDERDFCMKYVQSLYIKKGALLSVEDRLRLATQLKNSDDLKEIIADVNQKVDIADAKVLSIASAAEVGKSGYRLIKFTNVFKQLIREDSQISLGKYDVLHQKMIGLLKNKIDEYFNCFNVRQVNSPRKEHLISIIDMMVQNLGNIESFFDANGDNLLHHIMKMVSQVPNAKGGEALKSLFKVLSRDKSKVLELLIVQNNEGYTPMHFMIGIPGALELFKSELNSRPYLKDLYESQGLFALLEEALRCNSKEWVNFILHELGGIGAERMISINYLDKQLGYVPFFCLRDVASLDLAISEGADFKALDSEGRNFLHRYLLDVYHREAKLDLELVRFVVRNGCEITKNMREENSMDLIKFMHDRGSEARKYYNDIINGIRLGGKSQLGAQNGSSYREMLAAIDVKDYGKISDLIWGFLNTEERDVLYGYVEEGALQLDGEVSSWELLMQNAMDGFVEKTKRESDLEKKFKGKANCVFRGGVLSCSLKDKDKVGDTLSFMNSLPGSPSMEKASRNFASSLPSRYCVTFKDGVSYSMDVNGSRRSYAVERQDGKDQSVTFAFGKGILSGGIKLTVCSDGNVRGDLVKSGDQKIRKACKGKENIYIGGVPLMQVLQTGKWRDVIDVDVGAYRVRSKQEAEKENKHNKGGRPSVPPTGAISNTRVQQVISSGRDIGGFQ